MLEPLTNLANRVFEKMVDFFDVFDLSFFVSGAMVLAGMIFMLTELEVGLPPFEGTMERFGAAALSCYLLGLMAFASGRYIRRVLRRGSRVSVADKMERCLRYHDLLSYAPFTQYSEIQDVDGDERDAYAGALYTRFWAEIRENRQDLQDSYTLLRRYWVLCATYDGMAVALAFWLLIAVWQALGLYIVDGQAMAAALMGIVSLALGIMVKACFVEADRLKSTQIDEVVACLAHLVAQRSGGQGTQRRASLPIGHRESKAESPMTLEPEAEPAQTPERPRRQNVNI